MKIWIMRHGEASYNARSDSERPLTPFGVTRSTEQGQWLAARWHELQVTPDKVIVSPYTRAQQTFAALGNGLQAGGISLNSANIETWDGITPAGDERNVVAYLDFLRNEGAQNVLLVSHLPLVEYLTQALTQEQSHVAFFPASIAEVEWDGQRGKVIA